jgi:biopolymer transport protein ExbB
MFEKLYAVFKAGGFTLIAMLACSIIAVAVAIERAIHLWSFQERARDLADAVKRGLYRGAIAEARTACERSRSPLAEVLLVGFERLRRSSPQALGAAVDRERQRVAMGLRGPLWVLGTIGATTPFLGLFGTVVGIMGAFRRIGENKQTGIEVVGPYISEALIATAVGIGVAVVALMLFNFFQARLGRINIELRLLVEEFVELLNEPPAPASADSPAADGEDADSDGERASERPLLRKKERG